MELSAPFWEKILRLVLAVILTGFIGLEREKKGKPAGLKTLTLVGLGSCAFTLITLEFYFHAIQENSNPMDPIRIIAGIVGGIGFLGAGSILQSRGSVEGITTAASIWVAGAVGVACGFGDYLIAVATVFFTVLILFFFKLLEKKFLKNNGKV